MIWDILILYWTFGDGMSSGEMCSYEMSSDGMYSDGMSSDEMSSDGMFCMGTIICVLGNYHSGIHLGGACK